MSTKAPVPSRSAEYAAWSNLRRRTIDDPRFPARWRKFDGFLADIGRKPAGARFCSIATDGKFAPEAVRWIVNPPKAARPPRRRASPARRTPFVSTVTTPAHVGPHVRLVFDLMREQNVAYSALSRASGVGQAVYKAWRGKNAPGTASLTDCLLALGRDFLPVPRAHVLPDDLRSDLGTVAAKHGEPLEAIIAEWVRIVSGAYPDAAQHEEAA